MIIQWTSKITYAMTAWYAYVYKISTNEIDTFMLRLVLVFVLFSFRPAQPQYSGCVWIISMSARCIHECWYSQFNGQISAREKKRTQRARWTWQKLNSGACDVGMYFMQSCVCARVRICSWSGLSNIFSCLHTTNYFTLKRTRRN